MTAQPIIGGDIFTDGFEAVCSMFVTLPPDEQMDPQDPIYCACTKVGPAVVLTAASCVEENLTADTLDDIDVRFGTTFGAGTQFGVVDVRLHRYYDPDQRSRFDLALLELDGDPAPPAVTVNTRALTDSDIGPGSADACGDIGSLTAGCAVMIGFGETENDKADQGAQHKVIVPVRSVEQRSILAGTTDQTTCDGDSGAPLFMDLGSGLELVAISSRIGNCATATVRTRVDAFADDFIFPFVDRFGGTCGLDGSTCDTGCPRTPDPDCDDCSWNDVCKEDCPTRDWDCDLGIFPGDACTTNGECELGGGCIVASDDDSHSYCSQPCVAGDDTTCDQAGMVCDDSGDSPECVWPAPTPGSQGFPCASNLDCRSGICEETICVNECNPGDADPCPENVVDPDAPYSCTQSSTQPGKNVCLGVIFSGGGGFCTVGAASRPWQQGGEALLILGAVLIGLRIRRRS